MMDAANVRYNFLCNLLKILPPDKSEFSDEEQVAIVHLMELLVKNIYKDNN